MIFSSLFFLFAFLPAVLCLYYGCLKKQKDRNVFLLSASLFFYSWGEPEFVKIMVLNIIFNFIFGQLIGKEVDNSRVKTKKLFLFLGVMANLIPLFLFKYEPFFVGIFNKIAPLFSTITLKSFQLLLPIGISFYTFQGISYLVDVYRKEVPSQKSIIDLGLYIAFFPQLIAGPIVRYHSIAEQIQERTGSVEQFHQGIRCFIVGLGSKVIVANQLAVIAEQSFGSRSPSVTFSWLGAIAYSLQIYYDFSGYSLMAIGLGKMFGFDFMENFRHPYESKSVSEFWRRWHISLGAWFRDYLYIPLGGSRGGNFSLLRNLFFVWLFTGLWHGADVQFILWGMMYFILISFEKFTGFPEKFKNQWQKSLYQWFTLLCVVVSWVIFGEDGLLWGLHHIASMFGIVGLFGFQSHITWVDENTIRYISNFWMVLLLSGCFATSYISGFIQKQLKKISKYLFFSSYMEECVVSLWYLLIFFVAVSYLAVDAHNPFIYFNF